MQSLCVMWIIWKEKNNWTFEVLEWLMLAVKLIFLHTLYDWMAPTSGHSISSLLDLDAPSVHNPCIWWCFIFALFYVNKNLLKKKKKNPPDNLLGLYFLSSLSLFLFASWNQLDFFSSTMNMSTECSFIKYTAMKDKRKICNNKLKNKKIKDGT